MSDLRKTISKEFTMLMQKHIAGDTWNDFYFNTEMWFKGLRFVAFSCYKSSISKQNFVFYL